MAQIQRRSADVGERRTTARKNSRIHQSWTRHRIQLIWVKIGCGSDGCQPRHLARLRYSRVSESYAVRAIASPVHLASPGIGGNQELRRTCSSELRGHDVEAAHATQLQTQDLT